METIVTTYDENNAGTPQNHLLVLYSDPAYRAWLAETYPNKIYSYTSQKFGVTRNDWFDLGYVKGEPGGLHIIGQYMLQSGETYRDYLTDGVPPEDMPGNTPEDRGWAYLIVEDDGAGGYLRTIYTYDYKTDEWIVVSDLSSVTVHPTLSVIMDTQNGNVPEHYLTEPNKDGLWFVEKSIKAAY